MTYLYTSSTVQNCLVLSPEYHFGRFLQEIPLLSEVLDAPYNQVEPQEDKKSSGKPHKQTQPQSKAAREWWFWVSWISELCEAGCRDGACGALLRGVRLRSRAVFRELWSLSPAPCEGGIRRILGFSEAPFDLPSPCFWRS